MKKIILPIVVFVFTVLINAQNAIQEFDFNGTLSNTYNAILFLGNAKFVNDRAAVPNRALRLSNSYIEASVPNLPLANSQEQFPFG